MTYCETCCSSSDKHKRAKPTKDKVPDLREKIRKVVCGIIYPSSYWEFLKDKSEDDITWGTDVRNVNRYTDKLLVLMPDVEQAKREEGERILKLINGLTTYGGNEVATSYNQALDDVKQALKESK